MNERLESHAAGSAPGAVAPAKTPAIRRKPRTRHAVGIVAVAVTLAIVILAVIGWFMLDYLGTLGPTGAKIEKTVKVPKGASLKEIAQALEAEGLTGHYLMFMAYAYREGFGRKLQAGEYTLHTQMSMQELANALQTGKFQRKLTTPEGLTVEQVAGRFVKAGICEAPDEVISLSMDEELRTLAGTPASTIEGYLFPNTYLFESGDTARGVLKTMIEMFRKESDAAFEGAANPLPAPMAALTRHELTTLASMIEREARNEEEMPVIASVYYNRLKIDMKLECDATVRYALNMWERPVTLKDLEIESPYNTYRHKGLPPAPICSPGAPAMRAAAHPAETDYLFYVYTGGHGHHFTRTYEEHLKATADGKPPVSLKTEPEMKIKP